MRRLIAAVVGVLGAAATASAQYPPPAAVAGPCPGPGHGGFVMKNGSGHAADGGYFTTRAAFGDPSANNGAGSVWSDHSFVFGSSRTFFAPCGPYIPGPRPSIFGRLCHKGEKAAPCENGSHGNH